MSGVPILREPSSCPSFANVGVSEDGGEGNGNEGWASIPVLKMVEMIEHAGKSTGHSSPPLIRRRITRTTSESSLPRTKVEKRESGELKRLQDDFNPAVVQEKSAQTTAASSSSSGKTSRFQLDWSSVLEQTEKNNG